MKKCFPGHLSAIVAEARPCTPVQSIARLCSLRALQSDCTGLQGEAMAGVNWTQIVEVPGICKQEEVEPNADSSPTELCARMPPIPFRGPGAQ